jgi:RHS repeat-associated protein
MRGTCVVSPFRQSAGPARQPLLRHSLVLAVLSAVLLVLVTSGGLMAGSSPAEAGVWYYCPVGLHKFFGCVQPDKPPPSSCPLTAGDPVDILTGRLTEEVVDWSSGGTHPLQLKRQYTSTPLTLDASPYSSLGRGWRSNFDARVRMNAATALQADWASFILPDTMEYNFNKQNGVWKFMAVEWSGTGWPNVNFHAIPRTDLDVALTVEGQQFVLRAPNGVKYVFDTANHAADFQWHVDGYRTQLLSEIRFPGGYVQTISYNGDYPGRISDNLGRWITMQFSAVSPRSTLLTQVQTSDGSVISFAYQDRLPGLTSASPVDFMALSAVTYPDSKPVTISYQYRDEAGTPGLLLVGMTDERGVRFSTWTYDAKGRVLSSEHAGGQDRTQFAYDDVNSIVTVTNPLGRATRYSYRKKFGYVRQLFAVDGVATPGCAASNTRYEYDANGFRSKATDAEGRVTQWTRNSRGLPLTEKQAAGTPVERLSTMTWDATRPLLLSSVEPNLTTAYTSDAQGRVLTRTETDTTTQAVPYPTRGQKRTTTFTYAPPALTAGTSALVPLGPVAVDGPLPGDSDTVRYGYDAMANVSSVTDQLGHVTRFRRVYPTRPTVSVTDANGVQGTFYYDRRARFSRFIMYPDGVKGPSLKTAVIYDDAGQITSVIAPNGYYLNYTWSDARRLTAVTNTRYGRDRIEYGYNANGDQTSRTVKSASGAIVRQQSALFDELGRLMRAIGAAGQTTLFRYDRTDNLTKGQDPRGGLFAYAYDALQNLVSLTDPAGARTGLTRDRQGKVTAYRDPRGLTTSYVRNGFGEIIQESGPDVGTTVIQRDERGLATKITDPRGVVTQLSYDAAGRLVREAYPADPTQNVSYSYDSTAKGNKGVGRLTGITDASGSVARSYDALGRVIAETRVIAGKTYVMRYSYNEVGGLTSITYPSGRVVTYTRDDLGRVTDVSTRATAKAAQKTVVSSIVWSPMSRRVVSFTHGNGLAAARAYDGDGRLTSLKLAYLSTRLMDVSCAYGDGMNLTAVNDNLAAANSVSLAYDAARRLTSAGGPWGSLTYAYTPNGDRLREVLTPPGRSALTTLLTYPANSNRLASTSVGSLTTRSFTYDAAGNVTAQVMGPLRLAFAYNLRNRPVTLTRTGDGTQASTYLYNALEQMVQRSTNAPGGPKGAVQYIYGLDGSLLAEADATTGATLRDYIWLPQNDASPAADNNNEEGTSPPPLPLALVTGVNTAAPQLLMVHADHLGRPVRLTDAARTTVWSAAYDPFGQPWQVTGPVEQNLRFPGQYFLLESGLSYNWHRFYDPATGRYTQPDPLRFVDGPSVYGYASASPMMRVDKQGLCVEDACIGEGTAFCIMFPALCAATEIAVWNGCYWVFRKMSGGGGGGGPEEKDDPCEAGAKRDESMCRMATLPSTGPRARCWESVQARYGACRQGRPLPELVTW